MKKLLFALAIGVANTGSASAQSSHVNLSNHSDRVMRDYVGDDTDELPARNHGTGVRVGAGWARVRAAAQGQGLPTAFEMGVFHQRALNRAVSVQGEALYYRDAIASGTSSGFRLPALLVINPFYNISVHLGPQLQVRTGSSPNRLPAEGELSTTVVPATSSSARVSGGLVIGGEARSGFMRFGLRYGLPFNSLTDLSGTGKQIGSAWKQGQVQVYVGAGF